jgi:hypothetical protein
MEANLLGAQPSAATLRQQDYGEGDQQPSADGTEHRNQETEPSSFETISGHTHRTASLLVVVGVALAQLAWVALLAYGVYWLGTQLPV